MRSRFLAFIGCIACVSAFGQATGDYRSVVSSGEWGNNSSWETFDGASWVPASASPVQADGVITIQAGHTIDVVAALTSIASVDQVVIAGTLRFMATVTFANVNADVITVSSGGTLDVMGTTINFATNAKLRVNGNVIARNGSVFSGATATNCIFQANSLYRHLFTSAAGTIPLANWDATSIMKIEGNVTTGTPPTNLNQNFGNVNYAVTGASPALTLNGQLTNIKGGFSTVGNARPIFFNGTSVVAGPANYALTVNGDVNLAGGNITFSTASSGTATLNIVGSYLQTAGIFSITQGGGAININLTKNFTRTVGGSISKSGAGTANINFNGSTQIYKMEGSGAPFSGVINFIVLSGSTLDMASASILPTPAPNFINGAVGSSFTLNSGATVIVGSTDPNGAISSAGNIRVTTKNFISGSTVIYHNADDIQQFLGSEHPTNAGVKTIINNPGGVRLQPTSYDFNGDLELTNGDFDISGFREMTFGGTFTPHNNFLIASDETVLTISDGGSTADFSLNVSGTSVIGSLNIAGSTGRTVKLGADITVANELHLDNGDLQLNGFTLDVGGLIDQTLGTLTVSAASSLTFSDINPVVFPADLIISGGSLGTFTMSRVATEFTTSSNLNITTLNLTLGTFTHTGTVTMAANGKVNVASGILTNPLAAVSQYDVEYNGADEANTGAELPTSGTTLRHLIVSNPAQVNLQAPVVVNGNLTLSDGIFASAGANITLRGNFQSDATSDFTAGTTFFDGATTITGSVVPLLGNVTINATKSLALSATTQINVAGNFADNGTFTPNQGIVSLNGDADQFLTGAVTTNFYALEVNKATPGADVTVQHAVNVRDVLRVLTVTQVAAGTNQLTLVSTVSRTARVNPLLAGAAITGSVIVQRYLPNGNNTQQYRYLSSPVANTFVSDWQQEVPITGSFSDPSSGAAPDGFDLIPTEINMYYYDEAFGGPGLNTRYRNYPASGSATAAPLVPGRGYSLYTYAPASTQFDSRGTLGQQGLIVNVTAQGVGVNDGWNLVGNPYPSPIHWNRVNRSISLDAGLSVPDNTNINGSGPKFLTYAGGVGVPATYTGTIDMGQAFWVHTAAAGTITFEETDKIVTTDSVGQIYREVAPSDVLRIALTGATSADEIAIRFADDASGGFDKKYDAFKMFGAGVNLSSLSTNNREMTINALNTVDCSTQQIPLVVTGATAGSYTFSASGFESFGSDVDIRLVDKKTSATTDLRKTNTYSFTVTAQDISGLNTRFVVETGKTRLLADLPVSGPSICFSDFTANVAVLNSQAEMEYQVFSGQTAVSDPMMGNGSTLNLPIGTKSLAVGNTSFTITAKNSCVSNTLANVATVTKLDLTLAPQVTANALACSSDKAVLNATGAGTGQSYSWYTSADATAPLAVTGTGTYEASNITSNTSYFVSVSNSLGCQSERQKIDVKAVSYEPVEIDQNETVLTSSYFSGNQWYFNGSIMAGQKGPSLNATENGTYTVKVNVEGCTTEASIVQQVTGLEEPVPNIGLYPNPVEGSLNIEFPGGAVGTSGVSIISTSGKIVYSGSFSAPGTVTIDTSDIAAGVYIVRLEVDGRIISKKIIKI